MLIRLLIHLGLLLSLISGGIWLVYLDLTPASEGGLHTLDGLGGAMYWFALCIFVLLSSLFYVLTRNRSIVILIFVYILSAGIAVAVTITIVTLGEQAAESRQIGTSKQDKSSLLARVKPKQSQSTQAASPPEADQNPTEQ